MPQPVIPMRAAATFAILSPKAAWAQDHAPAPMPEEKVAFAYSPRPYRPPRLQRYRRAGLLAERWDNEKLLITPVATVTMAEYASKVALLTPKVSVLWFKRALFGPIV